MRLFETDGAPPTEAAAHFSSQDRLLLLSDRLKTILNLLLFFFLLWIFFENGSARIQILEFHQSRQVCCRSRGRWQAFKRMGDVPITFPEE